MVFALSWWRILHVGHSPGSAAGVLLQYCHHSPGSAAGVVLQYCHHSPGSAAGVMLQHCHHSPGSAARVMLLYCHYFSLGKLIIQLYSSLMSLLYEFYIMMFTSFLFTKIRTDLEVIN